MKGLKLFGLAALLFTLPSLGGNTISKEPTIDYNKEIEQALKHRQNLLNEYHAGCGNKADLRTYVLECDSIIKDYRERAKE